MVIKASVCRCQKVRKVSNHGGYNFVVIITILRFAYPESPTAIVKSKA